MWNNIWLGITCSNLQWSPPVLLSQQTGLLTECRQFRIKATKRQTSRWMKSRLNISATWVSPLQGDCGKSLKIPFVTQSMIIYQMQEKELVTPLVPKTQVQKLSSVSKFFLQHFRVNWCSHCWALLSTWRSTKFYFIPSLTNIEMSFAAVRCCVRLS